MRKLMPRVTKENFDHLVAIGKELEEIRFDCQRLREELDLDSEPTTPK
jgi:hypothetical protein